MKHCNNHLKLLNNIIEILQKEREARIDINVQDCNRLLHLGNLENSRSAVFQNYDKSPGKDRFLLRIISFVI